MGKIKKETEISYDLVNCIKVEKNEVEEKRRRGEEEKGQLKNHSSDQHTLYNKEPYLMLLFPMDVPHWSLGIAVERIHDQSWPAPILCYVVRSQLESISNECLTLPSDLNWYATVKHWTRLFESQIHLPAPLAIEQDIALL